MTLFTDNPLASVLFISASPIRIENFEPSDNSCFTHSFNPRFLIS